MDGLLSNLGCESGSHMGPFIDSYRCFHPKQKGAFTCWSTVSGARHLNYGSRLDYVLGDRTLVIDTFQDSFLLPEVMGSDHCPVGAVLSVSSVPAKQCPPLCTCFLPEFAGTQLKILRFLVHLKQDPVFKQSALQPSNQTQVYMRQNKARVRSTRSRSSKTVSSRGQKNLMSYFQPSSSRPQTSNLDLPSLGTLKTPKTSEEDMMANVVEGQAKASEAKDEKEIRTSFWKSLLGGPSPMPLCGGHREPCVMRTVKKPGPNLGRHFYMCARPQGPPTDPSSRCNFFLWSRPSWTNAGLEMSDIVYLVWSEANFLLSCLLLPQDLLSSSSFSSSSSTFLKDPSPFLFFFFLQSLLFSLFFLLSSSSLVSFLCLMLVTQSPTPLPTFLSEVHQKQLPQEVVILNLFLPCQKMYLCLNKVHVFVVVHHVIWTFWMCPIKLS